MLAGLGKRMFAYTNVAQNYLERTRLKEKLVFDSARNAWCDSNGMAVEDFGNTDNLMIDWAIADHGGLPIVRHGASPTELYRDLTGFETCLRLAAEAFAKPT